MQMTVSLWFTKGLMIILMKCKMRYENLTKDVQLYVLWLNHRVLITKRFFFPSDLQRDLPGIICICIFQLFYVLKIIVGSILFPWLYTLFCSMAELLHYKSICNEEQLFYPQSIFYKNCENQKGVPLYIFDLY